MLHRVKTFAGASAFAFALALALGSGSVVAHAQAVPSTPPSTMPRTPPSYAPPDASRDAVADAAITTSLISAFDADADLGPLKLNVDTSDGNVSLHGIVPSSALRERAFAMAANVRGVKTIENDLIVQR